MPACWFVRYRHITLFVNSYTITSVVFPSLECWLLAACICCLKIRSYIMFLALSLLVWSLSIILFGQAQLVSIYDTMPVFLCLTIFKNIPVFLHLEYINSKGLLVFFSVLFCGVSCTTRCFWQRTWYVDVL